MVSDARRLSDLQWFWSKFPQQTQSVRVRCSDTTRQQRGWSFTAGQSSYLCSAAETKAAVSHGSPDLLVSQVLTTQSQSAGWTGASTLTGSSITMLTAPRWKSSCSHSCSWPWSPPRVTDQSPVASLEPHLVSLLEQRLMGNTGNRERAGKTNNTADRNVLSFQNLQKPFKEKHRVTLDLHIRGVLFYKTCFFHG